MRAHRRWIVGSIAVATATTLGAPAVAGAQSVTVGNFGVHGGVVKARDANDGRFQAGAHLELAPGSWVGIQAAVDYRSEEQFELQAGGLNAEVDVRSLPLTLSGKLYVPVLPKFAPYALGGAGWYHQKIDFSPDLEALGFQDRKDTAFGWHAGAGAVVRVSPRVGLFAEGRWIFLDPDRDLNAETVDQIEDFDYNSSHLLGGVNFYF